MKDYIFENNLENKLMEVNGLLRSVVSTLDIMCKVGEDTSNEELKQFIDCLVLIDENVKLIQEKQEIITQEFQTNYCN